MTTTTYDKNDPTGLTIIETGWKIEERSTCDRCGNKEVVRLISLPHRQKYVQICYVCFLGLKAYFATDNGD